jgi:hypothetical protein
MAENEEIEIAVQPHGFLRYVRDNPLAMVASALIVGMLLARFAFLGNRTDAPFADD